MIIKTPMPINCVDCDNRGIRGIVDCKLIYSGCANCGRHPNCPLKDDSDVEDCIDRKCVLDRIQRLIDAEQNNIDEHGDYMNYARERVNAYEAIQFFVESDYLCPSVTPQEPTPKKDLAVASECKLEDCIDRDYTARYVEEFANNEYVSEDEAETIYLIAEGVRHIPTVYPKSDNEVVTLEFSEDVDSPSKYQTSDGTWHTGMIPCDDAISRLAVRKAINRYIEKAQSSGVVDAFISFEELVIKTLPTVYPKNETVTEFADRCRECGKTFVSKSVLEDIKAECIRAVDKIPITFSKNDADDCLKRDIREIFDKYISGSEEE